MTVTGGLGGPVTATHTMRLLRNLEDDSMRTRLRLFEIENEYAELKRRFDQLEILGSLMVGTLLLTLFIPFTWAMVAFCVAAILLAAWPAIPGAWASGRAWLLVWLVEPLAEARELYRPEWRRP